jgi:hypothetical protein
MARNILIVAVLLAVMSEHPAAAKASAGWTHQFGTGGADEALGVTLDPPGNAYVVGWTFGTLPAQQSAGTVDAFIRKYDPTGGELWTRQFGSWERDFAYAVAVDGTGPRIVGSTRGALSGQPSAGDRAACISN